MPPVQVQNADSSGGRTPLLSCKRMIEVQGDLDGEMHPKTAPTGTSIRSDRPAHLVRVIHGDRQLVGLTGG